MFGRDVLLCCVLCHRELKDALPRNIIRVSRLSTRKDSKSSIKYFSKMWHSSHIMTIHHQFNQRRYKHHLSLTTNLRVSSAPAETRVALSGERQVCNTLSVCPINSATRVIAGYLFGFCYVWIGFGCLPPDDNFIGRVSVAGHQLLVLWSPH